MHLYRSTRKDSPFSRHFLKVRVIVHLSRCDQDLALTVRIRDLNRRFGGLHVSPEPRLTGFRRRLLRVLWMMRPLLVTVSDTKHWQRAVGRQLGPAGQGPPEREDHDRQTTRRVAAR
jgi:hypothetical protein